MPTMIISRIFGYNKARWIKAIFLGALAFFIIFPELRKTLFGWMGLGLYGMNHILGFVIAILLAICAWDAHYSG